MAQILAVENGNVKVGADDGSIVEVPASAVNYSNPKVGDQVKVYKDGEGRVIVAWDGAATGTADAAGYPQGATHINKHLFVWLGAFFFGGFGVDRFMRGQIGTGICKLLFGWLTLGLWSIIDFVIAVVKAYAGPFSQEDEVVFIHGHWAK